MATFVKANPTFSTEALAGTRVTKTTSTGATVGATVVGAGAATGGAAGGGRPAPAAPAPPRGAALPLVPRLLHPPPHRRQRDHAPPAHRPRRQGGDGARHGPRAGRRLP